MFARTFNEGVIDIDGDGTLDKVNGHVDGYTLKSVTGDPAAVIRFFTMTDKYKNPVDSITFAQGAGSVLDDPLTAGENEYFDAMYSHITAKNFSVSKEIYEDPSNNIAASDTPGQVGNTENLRSILSLRHNKYMFMEGAPEDFIETVISTMGVDAQQASNNLNSQTVMTRQIDNRRQSISGVSIDEEMGNLVRYQHAYSAAAKMIQTYAELLDILVNRLGL